jgi:hypothetical protein
MHVVRQDPRMVRSDPDCILGHSAGALPRMWELDLDTVSVSRSCDGNTVRGLRAVCCWALANNMIQRSKGLLFLVRYSRWLRCRHGRAGSGPLSPQELRNPLRAKQKAGYTLSMKAVTEAIIELPRDSHYVGCTATESP